MDIKKTRPFAISGIDHELHEELRHLSLATGRPLRPLVEHAIRGLFRDLGWPTGGKKAAAAKFDQMVAKIGGAS